MNTVRATIADLVADVRYSKMMLASERAGSASELAYMNEMLCAIRSLYARRHTAKCNKFGMYPELENGRKPAA